MRWKFFFTPVAYIDREDIKRMISEGDVSDVCILDVRHPDDYTRGHIPGAKLFPLPTLIDRMDELNPDGSYILYCDNGISSRIAAQILSGKGFDRVCKLQGGFRVWNGLEAFGPFDTGKEVFTGRETPEEFLSIAYGMEKGLYNFYVSMAERVNNLEAIELFNSLAREEAGHMDVVFSLYGECCSLSMDRQAFESEVVVRVMEGGMDIEEYFRRIHYDPDNVRCILELAIAVEVQAIDLYSRVKDRVSDPYILKAVETLTGEERDHLRRLGEISGCTSPDKECS